MRRKRILLTLILCMVLSIVPANTAHAASLSDEQTDVAEYLAEICTDNWEEYGILPSVCIAQAYMESHLGTYCYPNNLWGLYGGYTSFESLEDGTYEYLDILSSNDSYHDALYRINYESQINAIYDGGYCTDSREHYVNGIIWIIEEFNLTQYDQEIYRNCYMKTYADAVTWTYIND